MNRYCREVRTGAEGLSPPREDTSRWPFVGGDGQSEKEKGGVVAEFRERR